MNTKKINEIFGYAFFIISALRILLIVLILMRLGTNLHAIFSTGESVNYDYYLTFSTALGIGQIILAVASIIMIIINLKYQPDVIPGYLWGLGAFLVALLAPTSLVFLTVFLECGLYIKAGSKIRNKNSAYEEHHRTSKKMIKSTEWFYSDENKQHAEQIEAKRQKRMAKLEKELAEWKQLLDSGEIDEATYNEETNKLIEKEKRRSEQDKK